MSRLLTISVMLVLLGGLMGQQVMASKEDHPALQR